jgi:hypothetical protein
LWFKVSWGKYFARLYLKKKPFSKKGWWSGSRHRPQVELPTLQKKKKKKKITNLMAPNNRQE